MRVHFLLWLPMFVLGTAVAGQAATAVTLSPSYGHPTTVVAISGTSFGAGEAVDVYVDLVDTVLLGASSTGSISGSVTIPASAAPGKHYISALGRRTGDFAQTTFDVGTPWSQLGYSAAHAGANPWENTLSTSNVVTIGPKWINTGGSLGSGGATVAVNFGDVYVSLEGNGVEALSSSTGSVLWSYAAAGIVYASPTLSGGVLYVGSASTGTLYALNATTGAPIWSAILGGQIVSSATVANGIVYVGCEDDKVYALKVSSGQTVWTYSTGNIITASPTVVNGVVYIGSQDKSMYALNASSGAFIWSYATGGPVQYTAAVANGVVYVGSDYVYAIRAQSPNAGTLLWQYTTADPIYGSPAVANNRVFIGTGNGTFYALDAHSGGSYWTLPLPVLPAGYKVRSVAVANGVVYFTSDTNVFYAVDAASSEIVGEAATGPMFLGSPAISDGVAYIAALGGGIYAFSLPPNLNTNALPRAGAPQPASLHPDPRLRVSL